MRREGLFKGSAQPRGILFTRLSTRGEGITQHNSFPTHPNQHKEPGNRVLVTKNTSVLRRVLPPWDVIGVWAKFGGSPPSSATPSRLKPGRGSGLGGGGRAPGQPPPANYTASAVDCQQLDKDGRKR